MANQLNYLLDRFTLQDKHEITQFVLMCGRPLFILSAVILDFTSPLIISIAK